MKAWLAAAFCVAFIGVSVQVRADAPNIVPLQGYLTDPDGVPIDRAVRLDVALFGAATDGNSLFSESHANVVVDNGQFTIYLGTGTSASGLDLAVFGTSDEFWLEFTVDSADIISPRTRIGTVPFAADALMLSGRPASDYVRVLRGDTTIPVAASAGCAGLISAIASLDEQSIAAAATVTIEVEAGTYDCTEAILFRHANGSQVQIVGTGATPGAVILTFPAASRGIEVRSELGLLANLTLQGGDTTGAGIHVNDGARLVLDKVIVRDFDFGIRVINQGVARGTDVSALSNSVGVSAEVGGTAILTDSQASENTNSGFLAYRAGVVRLLRATANANGGDGFRADRAFLDATSSAATGNAGAGFHALNDANVALESITATGNTGYGYASNAGSYIRVFGTAPVTTPVNTAGAANLSPNSPTNTRSVIVGP